MEDASFGLQMIAENVGIDQVPFSGNCEVTRSVLEEQWLNIVQPFLCLVESESTAINDII